MKRTTTHPNHLYGLVACICFILMLPANSYSQGSREHIKNAIKRHGECRNVAITQSGGDLMIYGRNGYASKGCPSGLVNALKELHDDEEYIDDIQLTEKGKWLILYGNNGFRYFNIPYSLEEKIRDLNEDGEVINTATFSDDGDWIVITDTKYSASSREILNWLKDGERKHGELWTAHVTDDAIVAVYEYGFKYGGKIPDGLAEAATSASFDVYRIKFAGKSWFIADKAGNYKYYM